MKSNRFREVLAAGRMPVGHMILEFGTRGIAKLLETADVDFVFYDMEHSGIDMERIFDLIAWAKASPFTPIVRVPQGDYHFIARVLDAGALGIMVANVQSAQQARDIVAAAKYPPAGRRGVGLGMAHTDYLVPDHREYQEESNRSVIVICMIESEEGVENCGEIAATEGVDGLWVGHSDLSTNLGVPGEFRHERFLAALRTVIENGTRHGKFCGVQPGSAEQAAEWRAIGFNAFSSASDVGLYRPALQNSVRALREMK